MAYCTTQSDSNTNQNGVICCSLGILKFVLELAIQADMVWELSEKKTKCEDGIIAYSVLQRTGLWDRFPTDM